MAWIYGILNTKTDEVEYVGQTKGTIKSRFAGHKHGDIPMDVHMRKEGLEYFKPIKLKEVFEADLDSTEKLYIKTLLPKYNVVYKIYGWLRHKSAFFLLTKLARRAGAARRDFRIK